ncbi:MAG: hypothetical protein WAW37_16310 [Syntrophobacteraceae bacterium]
MGEPHFKCHFAAIDIGSHTTRMVVARIDGNELTPVCIERRVTRLARDFQRSRVISLPAMERTIRALLEYGEILRRYDVARISAGATGVVRLAANTAEFLEKASRETGIEVSVLSEEREAFLSAKGMLSVLPGVEGDFLSFDIGGGSTEFLLVRSGTRGPAWSASLPVGAAVLTEAFLAADPPGNGAVEEAALAVRKQVLAAKEQMLPALAAGRGTGVPAPLQLAGTAGTVTTLAAMYLEMTEYIPYRVNGLVLDADWLSRTIAALAEMPLARRRKIAGLEPGREDIILGGAVIAGEILACFARPRFVVTDAGLLEGLLLEIVEKESGLPEGLTTRLTWRLQKG